MTPVSVLLVDDNHHFLRLIARFLQEQCTEDEVTVVGVAHNGLEALSQAQTLRPQVILLDLAMPILSGLEVIPRLRIISPEVKIIVLTAYNVSAYQAPALAAGANGFVSKATLATDLLPVLRRLVQTSLPGSVLTS